MLDRAFRDTFRNLSTLFLVVAVITVPLHLVYSFAFRNVIATRDIHAQIREFPNYRQVRSVGPQQLTHASIAFWVLTGMELALVPLAVKATRRVLEVEEQGGVATTPDAWRHALRKREGGRTFAPRAIPAAAIAVIAAFVLGTLLEVTLLTAAELVGARDNWTVVGTVSGVARAATVPFVLTTIARARIAKADPLATPKLY